MPAEHFQLDVSDGIAPLTINLTRRPETASISARPIPIQLQLQSAITTELPTFAPRNAAHASTTCASLTPSMAGQ